ncbi:hypothetical protein HT031_001615 [Scenedesmus sp. PABB004]|nr:hypothetical protein HT031_001615 [Scenedesmus sp. PABB004]
MYKLRASARPAAAFLLAAAPARSRRRPAAAFLLAAALLAAGAVAQPGEGPQHSRLASWPSLPALPAPPGLLPWLRSVLGRGPAATAPPASAAAAPAGAGSGGGDASTAQSFEPLSGDDISAIQRMLETSGPQPAGAFRFVRSAGSPLPQLLALDPGAAPPGAAPAAPGAGGGAVRQGPTALAWLVGSYNVGGGALVELQDAVRQAVQGSVATAAGVPEDQVLTVAVANVSLALQFRGVAWPGALDASASPESHPGLAAVRTALTQLIGIDAAHVLVGFAPPSDGGAPGGGGGGARRLLQAAAAAPPVVVHVRFYNLDPSSTTALLSLLGQRCGAAAADGAAPALRAGAEVAPLCEAVFAAALAREGVPVSFDALSVAPAAPPETAVWLSVAVGLSPGEADAAGSVARAGAWLSGSAVLDILRGYNITVTARPLESYVVTETGALAPSGLSLLPDLLTRLLPAGGAPAGGGDGGGGRAPVSRAVIAGVCVAAGASLLALAGVAALLVLRRRPAPGVREAALPTAAAGDGHEGRRRRRRPRANYTGKYIDALRAAGGGAAAGGSPGASGGLAAAGGAGVAAHARHTLERGDSVTSAIKFDAEESGSGGSGSDDGCAAAGADGSCGASAASSAGESSGAAAARLASAAASPQRARLGGEPSRVARALGSGAASAYSLGHGGEHAASIQLSEQSGAAGSPRVQPLGASCWHAGGHVSGFLARPAEAARCAEQAAAPRGAPSPFATQSHQRARLSASGQALLASPFAAAEQQHSHGGGGGLSSPFASALTEASEASHGAPEPEESSAAGAEALHRSLASSGRAGSSGGQAAPRPPKPPSPQQAPPGGQRAPAPARRLTTSSSGGGSAGALAAPPGAAPSPRSSQPGATPAAAAPPLLAGTYDEAGSRSSFMEAVRAWRQAGRDSASGEGAAQQQADAPLVPARAPRPAAAADAQTEPLRAAAVPSAAGPGRAPGAAKQAGAAGSYFLRLLSGGGGGTPCGLQHSRSDTAQQPDEPRHRGEEGPGGRDCAATSAPDAPDAAGPGCAAAKAPRAAVCDPESPGDDDTSSSNSDGPAFESWLHQVQGGGTGAVDDAADPPGRPACHDRGFEARLQQVLGGLERLEAGPAAAAARERLPAVVAPGGGGGGLLCFTSAMRLPDAVQLPSA